MTNIDLEEVKPEGEDGDDLIPLAPEDAPESSTEQEGEVVETKPEEAVVNPLEQYIESLEKEVGTRRGPTETPEAYALRLEVTKLKRERREERKEIFEKPTVEPEIQDDDPLSGYDANEVSNFEKIFDVIAQKRGLVRKDELTAKSWDDNAQAILEDFQTKHKEYADDALWSQFKEEFQGGIYNTRPANPKLLAETFAQIHNKLLPSKAINRGGIAAGQEKIQAAAHGGTTSPKTNKKPIDPALKAALIGFSDEELEEMSQ